MSTELSINLRVARMRSEQERRRRSLPKHSSVVQFRENVSLGLNEVAGMDPFSIALVEYGNDRPLIGHPSHIDAQMED